MTFQEGAETPVEGAQPVEITEPTAPAAAPTITPEMISAVRDAVAGDIRTLHGELRRQRAELQTTLASFDGSRTDNAALQALSDRLEAMSASQDLLAQALLPEDQQAAFKQQRELTTLRRQVEQQRTRPPAPAPAAPAQPAPPAMSPEAQQAAIEVAGYAEALDLNISTFTPAEMEVLRANVPQDNPAEAARIVKANLKKIATQRTAPAATQQPVDPEAEVRQQVRQQTTSPTARATSTGARQSFRTELEVRTALVNGQIDANVAREWIARGLPWN